MVVARSRAPPLEVGANDSELLSSSTNKFRLLRRQLQVRILASLDPTHIDDLDSQAGKFTELICFALHLDVQSAIYSKRLTRLVEMSKVSPAQF